MIPFCQITRLKIDHNPFAKGFRQKGRLTARRRSDEMSNNSAEAHPASEKRRKQELPATIVLNQQYQQSQAVSLSQTHPFYSS